MKFLLAALAATTLITTPALAQNNAAFTGLRGDVTVGLQDVSKELDGDDVVYGVSVGVDVPLGDSFTAGVEANTRDVFDDNRQYGVSARAGYAFTPNVLGYAHGGYTNYRQAFTKNPEGYVVGAGAEFRITEHTYAKAQYSYTNFDNGADAHGVGIGLGLRF